jgi:TPP-dependent pyruvate/acetoin dehydrogenase alpha subunit
MWQAFTKEPISFIDDEGNRRLDFELHIDHDGLKRLYYLLSLTRAVDERAGTLVRQGQVGFYLPSAGQEACQVASVIALSPEDWVFPAHRDLGVVIARGMELFELFAHLFARSADPGKGRQLPGHFGKRGLKLVPPSSALANHLPAAVGVGIAARLKRRSEVAAVYFGEGASSEGDFYSAINFAGVFRAPVLFFCENNQCAQGKETAAQSIAVKAVSAGFEGYRVDGNDPLVVYELSRFAVERARGGGGPTLIEGITGLERHDPIKRFRAYLERLELWDGAQEEALKLRIQAEVDEAVRRAEAAPPPEPKTLFLDVYYELPWWLEEERRRLLKDLG